MTATQEPYADVAVPAQRPGGYQGAAGWVSGEWPTSTVGHPRAARHGSPYAEFEPEFAAEPESPEEAEPRRRAARRFGRTQLVTLAVALLLLAAGWQGYQLHRVSVRGDDQLSAERARSAVLAQRTEQLEKRLAGVFNPEAVSSKVLPSVFRVRAGQFTGTAFSVGRKAGAGQANLITNFHVVQSVFDAGNRRVFLERGGGQVAATIVKVSRSRDLALLRAARDIRGLTAAPGTVKPGQQVLVVGAPLGLEDSVTTGVVSAFRARTADTGPMIQFDAPINPGNSGGPVVDSRGAVVGIATAKARDAEGIGLAIPVRTACDTFAVCG
jgi:putative serine protease PepD